jgi:glycosyltransferase involved in cell wall biosynthesis
MVSCIMPTEKRPEMVVRAVDMFMQQDYPIKELVIVYNTDKDIPHIAFPSNVRLVRTQTKIIGNKRNVACLNALGDIIVQWDDDDIYNATRISKQVLPIINGSAHITGLHNIVFYEKDAGRCWVPTEKIFKNIFVENVHGGSLAFLKTVWEHCRYPNWKTGEDAGFLERAIRLGARLERVNGYDCFVYVRHQSNTWKFQENNFTRYPGWEQVEMPFWVNSVGEASIAGSPHMALSGQRPGNFL